MEVENKYEQCRGCMFWQPLGSATSGRACHFLLYTGKRRERDGDLCLSRREKKPWNDTLIYE